MNRNAVRAGLLMGALLGGTALTAHVADASHFRGAALVPTVSSTGLLTIQETSFWRKGASNFNSAFVSGAGTAAASNSLVDTTDSRFDRVTQTHTIQLSGAGT